MSAVNYLNTISSALIGMITLSGIFVCGYHAIKMIQAEDEYGMVRAKKNRSCFRSNCNWINKLYIQSYIRKEHI